MKAKFSVLMVLVLGAMAFTSCSDDDNGHPGNDLVQKAFMDKYPGATHPDWSTRGSYWVVDFWKDNHEKETWFDQTGLWYMTKTELLYEALPQAVKTTFEASEYAAWHREDVDMLERPDMETLYIIEVEQGNTEFDLIYTVNGSFVKAAPDSDDDYFDYLPPTLASGIQALIDERYPQARIIDVEPENGLTEVEILHENRVKEVYFNSSGEWIRTSWEVRISELPAPVTAALQASEYANWQIDDADYVETPTGTWYLLEMEQGNKEVYLKISPQGEILP